MKTLVGIMVFGLMRLSDRNTDPLPVLFQVAATEHFEILAEAGTSVPSDVTRQLDDTYRDVAELGASLEWHPRGDSARRLPVVLLDSADAFRQYCQRAGIDAKGGAGVFDPPSQRAVFSDVWKHPDERVRSLILRHEAAHQVLYQLGVHTIGAQQPEWWVEGLACLFEPIRPELDSALPILNRSRLTDLDEALGPHPREGLGFEECFRSAVSAGSLLRLRDFVSEPAVLNAGENKVALRYAQAWSVVYFLHQERHTEFREYARRIASRRPGVKVTQEVELVEFGACFGRPEQSLERDWKIFVARLLDRPAVP